MSETLKFPYFSVHVRNRLVVGPTKYFFQLNLTEAEIRAMCISRELFFRFQPHSFKC